MKKKILTFTTLVFTLTVFAVLLTIVLTGLFPKKVNVFDELYYEVRKVRSGGESVLISGTESAYADYDFGTFMDISIPDLHISLSIEGESLNLYFSRNPDAPIWEYRTPVHFRYDVRNKVLYGERSEIFLKQHFLCHYFLWCNQAGETEVFSLDNLGSYTFVQLENKS